MRILADTNILFSALLFPNSIVAKTLLYITRNHSLILCDQNIKELHEITKRKKPELSTDLEIFLVELGYEIIPSIYDYGKKLIRDATDQPIVNSAIVNEVDIILTGDKDFLAMDLDRPICMNVREFLERYNIKL